MKWFKILHFITSFSAVAGMLALIGAWIATANGSFLGLSEEHLFNDAKVFLLISIVFSLAIIAHLQKRTKG